MIDVAEVGDLGGLGISLPIATPGVGDPGYNRQDIGVRWSELSGVAEVGDLGGCHPFRTLSLARSWHPRIPSACSRAASSIHSRDRRHVIRQHCLWQPSASVVFTDATDEWQGFRCRIGNGRTPDGHSFRGLLACSGHSRTPSACTVAAFSIHSRKQRRVIRQHCLWQPFVSVLFTHADGNV
jgi:hypothetical protein